MSGNGCEAEAGRGPNGPTSNTYPCRIPPARRYRFWRSSRCPSLRTYTRCPTVSRHRSNCESRRYGWERRIRTLPPPDRRSGSTSLRHKSDRTGCAEGPNARRSCRVRGKRVGNFVIPDQHDVGGTEFLNHRHAVMQRWRRGAIVHHVARPAVRTVAESIRQLQEVQIGFGVERRTDGAPWRYARYGGRTLRGLHRERRPGHPSSWPPRHLRSGRPRPAGMLGG